MKSIKVRFFCMTVGWALLCVVLSACGSSPAPVSAQDPADEADAAIRVPVSAQSTGPADELDAAIREASTYLNGRVPKGSKAVFLNMRSDYPDLSEYILSVLSENAVNDGIFSVVDRQQLDTIRAELNFQMSGEVSDESAQSIGQMLGAQSIVSGAVSKLGSLYRVQVKAIEVQSAGVQGQWSRNVPNGATIAALTERYSPAPAITSVAASARSGSSGGGTAQTAQAAQTPVPEAPKTYKIGEAGPAGGLVFYDKGNNSGGWRYLEAAPTETEENLSWLTNEVHVDGTKTELGTGKKNTQLIIADLSIGVPEAALHCVELEYEGFQDWFLPNKDELNLMYINLNRKNLGDFADELYWSSSEAGYIMQYAWAGPGDGWRVWVQNFKDASQSYGYMNRSGRLSVKVRAIRQF